jgi:two-component system phosphate regulon sensor histidine kinase PhoR
MKLWLKISLLCCILLVIALGSCSTILLIQSGDHTLQLTVQSAARDQRVLAESFRSMANNLAEEDLSDVTQFSLARYCFSSLAYPDSVLVAPTGTLYSRSGSAPEELLPVSETSGQQYIIRDVGSDSLLIVGSSVTLMEKPYSAYIVRDISAVYGGIRSLAYRFMGIGAACILITAVLMVLLVRFALNPLGELNEKVRTIAGGVYDQRIAIAENDEVGQLGSGFNRMAAAVEAHVQELKDEAERRRMFMAALTHEYKTPLTSIIGYAETLLWTKLEEETARVSLAHIQEQGRWLERLTQKLMGLLRISGDAVQRVPESIPRLLEDVRRDTAALLAQRGIALDIRCEMDQFPLDRDLMLSLLINLVDNAAKASSPGQTVVLRAYGNIIEVSDAGRGIPASELPRITQPFYRVDKSRSKKTGGAGLGLALCREIAAAHGARLEFESEPGKGTTARVVLSDD